MIHSEDLYEATIRAEHIYISSTTFPWTVTASKSSYNPLPNRGLLA